ncbi:Uncharacterized protein FWK35_00025919, partial [Aphis craccivora]
SFSDSKVNLVGAFGRSFFKFPNSFQKHREKPKKKKMKGKREVIRQNQFSNKSIFLYGFNSKNNHCKYLKFLPNTTEIFGFYEKFLQFFLFKFLRNLSKNLQIKNTPLIPISRRYLKILPTTEIFNFSEIFFGPIEILENLTQIILFLYIVKLVFILMKINRHKNLFRQYLLVFSKHIYLFFVYPVYVGTGNALNIIKIFWPDRKKLACLNFGTPIIKFKLCP